MAKTPNAKINETKIRIANEIGERNSWITRGREIENYLSDKTVSDWLFEKLGHKVKFKNDSDTKLEDSILKSNEAIKLEYNKAKTLYSSEIVKYIDENSLAMLDLKKNVLNLIDKIRKWNK